MVEFAKGVNLKVYTTKFGELINVGINKKVFIQNENTGSDWINFTIKKSKSGKYYAELNDYKKGEKENSEDTENVEW